MSAVNEAMQIAAVDLGALLDAGDGAFVTLEAGETLVGAHKAVLAARSPVFEAMFRQDTPESSTGVVSVPDVDGSVLRQLVSYCYSLQAPQLPAMAGQLLMAADRYGLSDLKAACEQQLAAQLTVENAAASAVLAVRHSCPNLTAAAVEFMKAHTLQVMMTQGWADALLSQPHSVLELTRLIAEPPAENSVAATPVEEAQQPHSGHGHTADAAAPHTDACHSPPPDEATISHMRVAATPVDEAEQPHTGHGHTAGAAAPHTDACHSPPPDEATISHMRNLSREEKGRRLLKAAMAGAVEELQALLAAGADVEARDEAWCDWTALHWAADRGNMQAVRCLLEAGADIEARTSKQNTALHLAAWSGHAAVVRQLLGSSADPYSRGERGQTPLHFAAEWSNAEAAFALLEGGANREAQNDSWSTPLMVAENNHHHNKLVQILTSR